MAQEPFQSKSKLFCLDLLSVPGAYGIDRVGEDDASLEKADAPVELEGVRMIQIGRQAEVFECLAGEDPLITNVVNRQ